MCLGGRGCGGPGGLGWGGGGWEGGGGAACCLGLGQEAGVSMGRAALCSWGQEAGGEAAGVSGRLSS